MRTPTFVLFLLVLAIGCQKTGAKVEDVDKHPLLQRPNGLIDPVAKAPAQIQELRPPIPKREMDLKEAVELACDPTVPSWKRLEGLSALRQFRAGSTQTGITANR